MRAHWDEALRLAVSVGSGHTSASGMLRRLAAYPRQNGLAVALREIGRIERSLFTPDSPVRPDGARHQWRKVPPRELSVDLVADERLVWATGRVEAS